MTTESPTDGVTVIAGPVVSVREPPAYEIRHPWCYELGWWLIGLGARCQRWAAGAPLPAPSPYYYTFSREERTHGED